MLYTSDILLKESVQDIYPAGKPSFLSAKGKGKGDNKDNQKIYSIHHVC
jgi:hypothetical protein